MHLRRCGSSVVVHAPAKLNLFFEVLDRRSDGFHEVETLVYPIGLCDTIAFRATSDEQIQLDVTYIPRIAGGEGAPLGHVPNDGSNLIVRALDLLRRHAGVAQGAKIVLFKRIPSAAGLGGGSSDAAAALAAANVCWHLDLPREQLAELGAELGSDIPLFFHSGPSLCRGRGEIIESLPTGGVLHFVVVRPPAGLSTGEVYGACRIAEEPHRVDPFAEAFGAGDLGRMAGTMFNRLETAAEELSPWIARVRRGFDRTDCVGHQMTGSGTCYFGLCRHERHARRVAGRLQAYGIGSTYVVRGCR